MTLGEDADPEMKAVGSSRHRLDGPRRDSVEVRRLARSRGQSETATTGTQVVPSANVDTLEPAQWRRYVSSRADDPAEVALSRLRFLRDDRRGTPRATVGGGAAGRAGAAGVAAGGVRAIQDETFALAGESAVFELVGEGELRVILPATQLPAPDGLRVRVSVRRTSTDEPLPDAHVLLIHRNRTSREARTDLAGRADFRLHVPLPVTVLCAARGFQAAVALWRPAGSVDLRLRPTRGGGSVIIGPDGGHVPGIRGRLDAVLDEFDRIWLHGASMAINNGAPQPVRVNLREPVHLTDSRGARATVWLREMIGTSCVLDYRHVD